VASKRLVLDANILIRAVLGVRVRSLIELYCERIAFFVAEAGFAEAENYLAEIAAARGIAEVMWRETLARVMDAVQTIAPDALEHSEVEARARIGARDPEDWPTLAAALLLECPIWTEDQDFFGSGVATWTTATVEHFLRAP
jgi:predicted nucleic acid-binding protein